MEKIKIYDKQINKDPQKEKNNKRGLREKVIKSIIFFITLLKVISSSDAGDANDDEYIQLVHDRYKNILPQEEIAMLISSTKKDLQMLKKEIEKRLTEKLPYEIDNLYQQAVSGAGFGLNDQNALKAVVDGYNFIQDKPEFKPLASKIDRLKNELNALQYIEHLKESNDNELRKLVKNFAGKADKLDNRDSRSIYILALPHIHKSYKNEKIGDYPDHFKNAIGAMPKAEMITDSEWQAGKLYLLKDKFKNPNECPGIAEIFNRHTIVHKINNPIKKRIMSVKVSSNLKNHSSQYEKKLLTKVYQQGRWVEVGKRKFWMQEDTFQSFEKLKQKFLEKSMILVLNETNGVQLNGSFKDHLSFDHPLGLACDVKIFTLKKITIDDKIYVIIEHISPQQVKERWQEFKKEFQTAGFPNVLDEYNVETSLTNGQHIHLSKYLPKAPLAEKINNSIKKTSPRIAQNIQPNIKQILKTHPGSRPHRGRFNKT